MTMLLYGIPVLLLLLLLAGGAYAVLRAVGRDRAAFSYQAALGAYFAIASGVSLLVLALGLSLLLTATFAAWLGPDFSYRPTFGGPIASGSASVASTPVTAQPSVSSSVTSAGANPTPIPTVVVRPTPQLPPEIQQRQAQDFDRQQRTGLAQGLSLLVTGGLLWGLHQLARRALLPPADEPAGIRRTYAAVMLAIFSLIGVVAVPTAVAQVVSYTLAPPQSLPVGFGAPGDAPGGTLATAMAVIPFWAYYFSTILRGARSAHHDLAGPSTC